MKKVSEMKSDEIKQAVRDAYSRVAEGTKDAEDHSSSAEDSGCCPQQARPQTSSCCGSQEDTET